MIINVNEVLDQCSNLQIMNALVGNHTDENRNVTMLMAMGTALPVVAYCQTHRPGLIEQAQQVMCNSVLSKLNDMGFKA